MPQGTIDKGIKMSDSINIRLSENDIPTATKLLNYIRKHFQEFEFDEDLDLFSDLGFIPVRFGTMDTGFEYNFEQELGSEICLLTLSYYSEADLRTAQIFSTSIYKLANGSVIIDDPYFDVLEDIKNIYDSLIKEEGSVSQYTSQRELALSRYEKDGQEDKDAATIIKQIIGSEIIKVSQKRHNLCLYITGGDYLICKQWQSDIQQFEEMIGKPLTKIERKKSDLLIEIDEKYTVTFQKFSVNFARKIYPAIYSSEYRVYLSMSFRGVSAQYEYP